MLEDPETLLTLVGIFVSATVTFAALFVRENLRRRRERWQRSQAYQPLINQITVRLGEMTERTHDLHERKWEFPFNELPFSEEDIEWFESRFNQTADISKDAARSLNDLVRIMLISLNKFERLERIVRNRALELMGRFLVQPSRDEDEYYEYRSLFMNQEYHFWVEHLYNIEDGIWQFARALHPHAARKDTRRDLASIGLLRATGAKNLLHCEHARKFGEKYSPEGI